jgi:hypothetical protein
VENCPLSFKGKDQMKKGKISSISPPRKKWEQQMGTGDNKRKVQQTTGDKRLAGQGSGSGCNQGSGQEVPSTAGPFPHLPWIISSVKNKN